MYKISITPVAKPTTDNSIIGSYGKQSVRKGILFLPMLTRSIEMMMDNSKLGFNILERLCFLLRDRLQAAYGAMEKI